LTIIVVEYLIKNGEIAV